MKNRPFGTAHHLNYIRGDLERGRTGQDLSTSSAILFSYPWGDTLVAYLLQDPRNLLANQLHHFPGKRG